MKYSLLMFCIFLFSACDYTTELPIGSVGGKLIVECFLGSETDTTYLKIFAARPANKPFIEESIDVKSVIMKVNGEECELYKKSGTGDICYYSIRDLKKGDNVSLYVDAKGYPPVSSTTTLLNGPDFMIERALTNGRAVYKVFVEADLREGGNHYYGYRMLKKISYESVSWASGTPVYKTEEKYSVADFYVMKDFNDTEEIPGYRNVMKVQVNNKPMVIAEAEKNSKVYELSFSLPYERDRYEYRSLTDTTVRKFQYNLEVFNIGRLAYNYLNPQVNFYLLSAGLVPPFLSMGNISGGYGVLGSFGRSSTGWMENIDTSLE